MAAVNCDKVNRLKISLHLTGCCTFLFCVYCASTLFVATSAEAQQNDHVIASTNSNSHVGFIPRRFLESIQAGSDSKLVEIKSRAEQGDLTSQVILGGMYEIGHEESEDKSEAAKWYRKAAEANDPRGQILLGELYLTGTGVVKDATQAVKLFYQAAKQRNVYAQVKLASLYVVDEGVQPNLVEAYKWCNIALVEAKPADLIQLQGLALWGRRFATLNNQTIGQGEFSGLKTPLGTVMVTCNRIETNRVSIQVKGEATERVIMRGDYANPCAEYFTAAFELRTILETNLNSASLAEAQRRSSLFIRNLSEPGLPDTDFLNARGYATAFFITEDGYAITSYHVVKRGGKISLKSASGTYPAKIIKSDPDNDLALLKVSGRFAALPLQSSAGVRLGASVFTVGFPNPKVQGLQPKLTKGEVSGVYGIADDVRTFQVSVPVQPGNSGGALVNLQGNVVGVIAARLDDLKSLSSSGTLPQNVNYAVKSAQALLLLTNSDVIKKLKQPSRNERKLEDLAAEVEKASVMVMIE